MTLDELLAKVHIALPGSFVSVAHQVKGTWAIHNTTWSLLSDAGHFIVAQTPEELLERLEHDPLSPRPTMLGTPSCGGTNARKADA